MNPQPKPRRVKNESYRQFVAGQPCFSCGVWGLSQACHPNGAGMGTKASDLECFPLCCTRQGIEGCHFRFDQCIGMTRMLRKELEAGYIARMQAIARAAGRPEFK